MRLWVLVLLIVLSACGNGGADGDLCSRTFSPYPDLVSTRLRSKDNAALMDAMTLYSKQDFAGAATGLEVYLKRRDADKIARLYLASCYLALHKPYDAELVLDHLEQSSQKDDFREQCEWYTVICWLCSDQKDRALTGARSIAGTARHTYRKEATALVNALAP
ncbi:MAG: hypothetical protein ABI432_01825 [Flavobacteriales bacterium]